MTCKTFFILIVIFFFQQVQAQQTTQNPHGKDMTISCNSCHTADSWNNVPIWKFNHDQTGFSLMGGHKNIQCSECHQNLIFNNIGVSCIDCHTDIHKGELGIQCENCHNSQSWENYTKVFEQHNRLNFPLVGVHANLDCEACHINEQERQFTSLSVECQSCHMQDYMSTISPVHKEAHFDLDCQKCHLQVARKWDKTIFEHLQSFPLVAAHKNIDCVSCHITGYNNTSNLCYSCHEAEYQNSVDPDHFSFGFPTVCENCHTEVSWERSTFDHFSESGFVVDGSHTTILCVDCHQNNQLTGIPSECAGCHQSDFDTALEPNHIQNNFSIDCLECHTTAAWDPALFDHAATEFPLLGAHAPLNCVECHSTGYQNTPLLCVACHESEFNNTSDPNHLSAQFPNTCEDCHSSIAWTPADWDHDAQYFPINSGAHREEWTVCADCHVNLANYSQFECINCHDHLQSEMDDKHKEEDEYEYLSIKCYECHPNGKSD